MERTMRVTVSAFFIGIVINLNAQDGAGSDDPRGWFDASVGIRSPSGFFGVGFGYPLESRFTPAVAAGIGGSEGTNWSLGTEYWIMDRSDWSLRGFGYWTYTAGSGRSSGSVDVSSGQMYKFGLAAMYMTRLGWAVIRVGYGGFFVYPVERNLSTGTERSFADNDEQLPGVVAAVGVVVPIKPLKYWLLKN